MVIDLNSKIESAKPTVDKNRIRQTNGGQESKIGRYPSLEKSYKKAFPFKIACPSYIYPAAIIPNVRALGPFVDEIELILFEGNPENLPTEKEIDVLETLAEHFDITFDGLTPDTRHVYQPVMFIIPFEAY